MSLSGIRKGENFLLWSHWKKFFLRRPRQHHSKFFRFPIPHEDRDSSFRLNVFLWPETLDNVQNFSHNYNHITVSREIFSFKYTIPLTCHTLHKNNSESTKNQCVPTALHLEHLNHVSGSYVRPIYYLEFLHQDALRTYRVNLYSVSAHAHTTKP